MAVNIVRGLNRLFVVFAVVWYIFGGSVAGTRWANTIRYRREAQDISAKTITVPLDELERLPIAKQGDIDISAGFLPRAGRTDEQALLRQAEDEQALPITLFVLAVPVAVYGLGISLRWAVRGFQSA
jgi:hypothetical protein